MKDLTDEQHEIMVEGVMEFNDTLLTQSINLSGQASMSTQRPGWWARSGSGSTGPRTYT
jgi:hypothetical protein